MRLSRMFSIGMLGLAMSLAGCHHGHQAASPAEAIADLNDPNWEIRRHAADQLRDDDGLRAPEGGPRPEALPALFTAIQKEQDPKVYGALLIAIGSSGIPEGRPLIDAKINDPSEDTRRWATRALKYWLQRNGLLGKDADLPPPPGPLYGPPPPLPPTAPGSHPGLVLVPVAAAPPGAPPPGAPPSPGPGPGGSI